MLMYILLYYCRTPVLHLLNKYTSRRLSGVCTRELLQGPNLRLLQAQEPQGKSLVVCCCYTGIC